MKRMSKRGPKGEPKPEELNQNEQELVKRDLEDLIREEGEDVDFDFYFEGRPVSNLSRTLFEMVKDSEHRRRTSDSDIKQVE